jgi:hypothetical protein
MKTGVQNGSGKRAHGQGRMWLSKFVSGYSLKGKKRRERYYSPIPLMLSLGELDEVWNRVFNVGLTKCSLSQSHESSFVDPFKSSIKNRAVFKKLNDFSIFIL